MMQLRPNHVPLTNEKEGKNTGGICQTIWATLVLYAGPKWRADSDATWVVYHITWSKVFRTDPESRSLKAALMRGKVFQGDITASRAYI